MRVRNLNLHGKLITNPYFEEVPIHEAIAKYIPPDYNSSKIEKVTFSFCRDDKQEELKVEVYGPLSIEVLQNLKLGDNCELVFDRIVGASSPLYPNDIIYRNASYDF